jgi:MYXO-CTERM domain-containing protein
MHTRFALLLLPLLIAGSSSSAGAEPVDPAGPVKPMVTGSSIASLALANVGGMACKTNSLGGSSFGSSCTGNGGSPEYWCADFALWVWANAGVSNVSGLDAAAGSFYVYGQNNGTLSNSPAVGDAVVFDYQGGGVADHVAIVTQVNGDGTIESVSGDWNGQSGSEATFSSTSQVVLNSPAYASTVGSTPGVMGMTISGFIAPTGLTQGYAASYVSQSFPLASTALKMTAGQTIPSFIEMKNSGGKDWDSKTHLGTTQPRDRASVFADSTWLATNRPAGVQGTVAVGGTYKFTFDLHAPDKPGTYYEYFNLVEEGVAWFSDPGQGGPPDDDLEVQIVVEAGPDAGTSDDAGTTQGDGGAMADAGHATGSGDAGDQDAGSVDPGAAGETGIVTPGDDAGTSDGATSAAGSSGGCATAPGLTGTAGAAWLLGLAVAAGVARRRRRLSA